MTYRGGNAPCSDIEAAGKLRPSPGFRIKIGQGEVPFRSAIRYAVGTVAPGKCHRRSERRARRLKCISRADNRPLSRQKRKIGVHAGGQKAKRVFVPVQSGYPGSDNHVQLPVFRDTQYQVRKLALLVERKSGVSTKQVGVQNGRGDYRTGGRGAAGKGVLRGDSGFSVSGSRDSVAILGKDFDSAHARTVCPRQRHWQQRRIE